MLNIITLRCPGCGANLEISPEMNTFACGYCGASQMVERRGGTIALRLLTDAISKVQLGTDKTAAELAIRRIKEELVDLDLQLKKIVGEKGHKHDFNNKIGMVSAAPGITFLLLSSAFTYPIFGIFFSLIALGGAGYFWYQRNTSINNKYELLLEEKRSQIEQLKNKMAAHKKIVDS